MNTPFVFGKLATGIEFTDRESETEHLVQNFKSLINTIILSPRRWGKSSLVAKATSMINEKKIRICSIDLYNIRNKEEFYKHYSERVLKAGASKIEELTTDARNFLQRFIPKITFSPAPGSDFSLSLDMEEVNKQPDDILELPENLAKKKKFKMIVCIDEFQNIGSFGDALTFQKKLRAHWQQHKNVTYCLYGSKRHMLMEFFASPGMPFYKFGDLIFLEKIHRDQWKSFIINRFKDTGKFISPDDSAQIAAKVEDHPFYVQQLAQLCWLRTSRKCNSLIIDESIDSLINQLSLLFQTITESLTGMQVNFLRAVTLDIKQLSSQETLTNFKLGTSGNVNRIKQALVDREIIDITGSEIFFLDPVYKHWLVRYYFQ